jgi:predicted lipoprotein with Yx(FWY)xxD motif
MRNRWLAASVFAAAAVVGLAACGGSSSSTPTTTNTKSASTGSTSTGSTTASTSATGIKTMSIAGRTVLTNAGGFVLYWFAPDTMTKSNCNGSCATYWPPLIGKPTLASGVTLAGQLSTIKRADGQLQATYDGHPLYLFKSDTAAGQWTGNDLNASGGLWWMMTSSGKKLVKKDTSSSSSGSGSSGGGSSGSGSGSSGSGGYGY